MIKSLNKKILLYFLITAVLITIASICILEKFRSKLSLNDNQNSEKIETFVRKDNVLSSESSIPQINEEILAEISTSTKLEIYHNFHNYFEPNYKPAVITDKALIKQFISFLKYDTTPTANSMSGMSAREGQKLIFYNAENEQTIIPFFYDSLYHFGYIEYKGEKVYLPYSFFRLIANAETYRPEDAGIPNDVSELLKKYKWTPAFLISSVKKTIPINLSAGSEDFLDKLYWAYNIELSKAEGMDFSNLLSKEVTAEIYNLVEELPDFSKPYLNARGIIIRYDNKIVGGFIDSGTNTSSVCTLSRKSFNDVTGKSVSEWLNLYHIDKNDSLYIKISKMSDEELIRTYFKAMEDKDAKTLFATMTTEHCLGSMFMNMPENKLYNTPEFGWNVSGYIEKAEIKEIKKSNLPETDKNKRRYEVTADITPTSNAVISKGVQRRYILLENDGGVWKIADDGTG